MIDPLWNVYRFDYARFLTLRPGIRAANSAAEFAALAVTEETEAVVDGLEEGVITVAAAREAFVALLCAVGDPVPLESGFAKLVASRGRNPAAEEAAERLSDLLVGGKTLPEWIVPATTLIGWLTPEETTALYLMFPTLLRARGRRGRRRRRKGGLVGACARFLQRLFDRSPRPDDMLALLGDLIETAVKHGEGMLVLAA